MKHIRKIFYNQKFDEFELGQLSSFEPLIHSQGIILPNE